MTYSQRSTFSAASSDITYLEVQIEAAKEELEQAKIAGQQTLLEAARNKLEGLESELAKFEE
ncbi:hypothetical protein [Paenibacillus wynnii]|uniref:hypothetical protein n=1 Tax=Paenibacillus wynnii TaxID=268407 RepID=UPI0027932943|nr:hypothetical protein [Paenibacillus wynnii]MDQ0194032.1 hypothetical protein [Paenibacillus wynnii]